MLVVIGWNSHKRAVIIKIMSLYTYKDSRYKDSKQHLQQHSNKKLPNLWIGQDTLQQHNENLSTPPPPPPQQASIQSYKTYQTSDHKTSLAKEHQSIGVGSKSPVQLMQDILRMVGEGQQRRIYYSRQAEQSLGELLTNRFKLSNYIKKIESEMVGLDSAVVKNYEMLVLLLQQLSGSEVQVRQGEGGMQIKFNRGVIEKQQAEIQRLEREKQQRERLMKYIVEEYQSVILNFNDVLEKLVNKEEGRHRSKY